MICKALHTGSVGACLYNMLVRLLLSDSCCHMAHTCSPKVTEKPPFVALAHPSPAPPHVILRGWWPFLCGAHITGVCWRGLHCQQSLYSLWLSLTDTSLNLCLPPSLPPPQEHVVLLPLPASQSWSSWSHYQRSFSLAFTTTPHHTVVSTLFFLAFELTQPL